MRIKLLFLKNTRILNVKYCFHRYTSLPLLHSLVNAMNEFFEVLTALEQRVQSLVERLEYQRAENQTLTSELIRLKKSLALKEEEVGLLNYKLLNSQSAINEVGSTLDITEIETKIDRLVGEIQTCIVTLESV